MTDAATLREVAEWLEFKPNIKVRSKRVEAVNWCCDYIASQLRKRADELDESHD